MPTDHVPGSASDDQRASNAVPLDLAHVGWCNVRSGVLHRDKMDFRPDGPWWVRVYARADELATAAKACR
jgi:hypothetical protein